MGEAGPSNRAEEDDELPDGSSDLPNGRSRDHSAKRNGRSRKRQSRVSVKVMIRPKTKSFLIHIFCRWKL